MIGVAWTTVEYRVPQMYYTILCAPGTNNSWLEEVDNEPGSNDFHTCYVRW